MSCGAGFGARGQGARDRGQAGARGGRGSSHASRARDSLPAPSTGARRARTRPAPQTPSHRLENTVRRRSVDPRLAADQPGRRDGDRLARRTSAWRSRNASATRSSAARSVSNTIRVGDLPRGGVRRRSQRCPTDERPSHLTVAVVRGRAAGQRQHRRRRAQGTTVVQPLHGVTLALQQGTGPTTATPAPTTIEPNLRYRPGRAMAAASSASSRRGRGHARRPAPVMTMIRAQ